MKIYYRLLSIPRIGQLVEELFFIKNLFPEEEIIIITSDPNYHPRINKEIFKSVTRNFGLKLTNNLNFIADRSDDDEQRDLIKFGDGFLFQKGPKTLRKRFYDKYTGINSIFYHKLNEEEQQQGDIIRNELGIKANAKIVTIHCREGGYLPDLKYHTFRDNNIANSEKAIDYLINQNYYVIRLGDPSMKILNIDSSRFIDLAHSRFTHTLAELYFISNADFHIGTCSGVDGIAQTCGIPMLLINCHVPLCIWGTKYDIDLPPVFYSDKLSRDLSLPELVISNVLTILETEKFNNKRISLIKNTADEIYESVKEMLKNITTVDYKVPMLDYLDRIDPLYNGMQRSDTYFGLHRVQNKKISDYYLNKNPGFLGIPF